MLSGRTTSLPREFLRPCHEVPVSYGSERRTSTQIPWGTMRGTSQRIGASHVEKRSAAHANRSLRVLTAVYLAFLFSWNSPSRRNIARRLRGTAAPQNRDRQH